MDLIRRDSAINIIADKQRELCPLGRFSRNVLYGTDREKFDAWQEIIDTLEELPSVEVKPIIQGKWVEETNRYYHWHCSECGQVQGAVRFFMNYCPNCGAKMDLEETKNGKSDT